MVCSPHRFQLAALAYQASRDLYKELPPNGSHYSVRSSGLYGSQSLESVTSLNSLLSEYKLSYSPQSVNPAYLTTNGQLFDSYNRSYVPGPRQDILRSQPSLHSQQRLEHIPVNYSPFIAPLDTLLHHTLHPLKTISAASDSSAVFAGANHGVNYIIHEYNVPVSLDSSLHFQVSSPAREHSKIAQNSLPYKSIFEYIPRSIPALSPLGFKPSLSNQLSGNHPLTNPLSIDSPPTNQQQRGNSIDELQKNIERELSLMQQEEIQHV